MRELVEGVADHIEFMNLGAGTVVVAVVIVAAIPTESAAPFTLEGARDIRAVNCVENRNVNPLILFFDDETAERTRGDFVYIAVAIARAGERTEGIGPFDDKVR